MALTKYKFGDLIELTNQKNTSLQCSAEDAIGVNIDKVILPMRGDTEAKDVSTFHLVPPRHFAYNPRGSRKLGIGFNNTEKTYIITFNDNVFRIKENAHDILIEEYLFMYLCRKEWDRYAEFISWGSSTEVFDWNEFCKEEIALPSLDIQKKYVAIYNSLLANQKSYERGLDDLKLVCDAYIEDLRRKYPCKRIGDYIKLSDTQNKNLKYGLENLKGISIQKKFIETKADMKDVPLHSYLVVQPDDFAYVTVTSRNGEKITLAHNSSNDTYIVSSSYVVFRISEPNLLDSKYLFLFLSRSEFDRYSRFHSWGSARETFDWQDMQEVCIPIPDIKLQNSIADIFEVYSHRTSVNERLKQQIKDICPILIKGSIEEAQK